MLEAIFWSVLGLIGKSPAADSCCRAAEDGHGRVTSPFSLSNVAERTTRGKQK